MKGLERFSLSNARRFGKYFSGFITLICLSISCQGANATVFPGVTWDERTPDSQGVNSVNLLNAITYLDTYGGGVGAAETVVVRNGYIIWKGTKVNDRHIIYSASKSFTTTVLGALLKDGQISSLNAIAASYDGRLLSAYPAMTFRHLATMTSGYNHAKYFSPIFGRYVNDCWTDLYGINPGEFDDCVKFYTTPGVPEYSPGTVWRYRDQAVHELGYILTDVTGQSIEDLFRLRIGNPIGMTIWDWTDYGTTRGGIEGITFNNPAGTPGGLSVQGGVSLTPLDLARYGLLYLANGNWNGQQLLDPIFVQDALTSNSFIPSAKFGFMWWTNRSAPDNGTGERWPYAPPRTAYAEGGGSNFCFVIPEWNMVIVRMSPPPAQIGEVPFPSDLWAGFFSRLAPGVLPAPLALVSVTVNPGSVIGGNTSQGTVVLSGPAPSGGTIVSLSSSNTAVAGVPASVTVPAGSTSAAFTITTNPVTTSTPVTISADYGGSTKTATLSVALQSSGLAAYWSMDSIVNGKVSDQSGNSKDGTVFGGVIVPGKVANALSLNGSSNYVLAPAISVGKITVLAWVNLAGQRTSSSQEVVNNTQDNWTLRAAVNWSNNAPYFFIKIGSTYYSVNSAQALQTGVWYHLAGTYDGETLRGYINGVEMSNSPNLLPSGLLGPVTGNVMIGEHPAGTNYFWGQIDDVRIYDHALTQQEIQTIYLNTPPPAPLALVSVTVNPGSVIGGNTSQGTVVLSGPAPSGGTIVSLSSSNTAVAGVPASVTVPAGSTSAAFTITTNPVTTSTPVTISADYGGSTKTATLSVALQSSGLAAYWSMDSIVNGKVSDQSGNSKDGTVFGGVIVPGKVANALSLNGSSNYVLAPAISVGKITVLAWVNLAGQRTSSSQEVVNNTQDNWTLRAAVNWSNNAPYFLIKIGSIYYAVNSAQALQTGVWYHLAGTYDGETLRGYINGVEMSNSPNLLPSGLLGPVTGNVMIGEHPAGTNYFWGQIDDVRIYDHALTQQEIQTIYLNTPPPAPLALVSVTVNPGSVIGGNTSQGTVVLSGPAPSGGTIVSLSSSNTAVAGVPASVTVPAGSTSAAFTITTNPVTTSTPVTISADYGGSTKTATLSVALQSSGLAAYWSMDSIVNGKVSDQSGNSKDGTVFGGVIVPGKVANALSLNGSSNYVLAPAISVGKITVLAWVNLAGQRTSSSQEVVNNTQDNWTLRAAVNWSNNAPYFFIKIGSTYYSVNSAQALQTGVWYHLAGTYDGETLRGYINGVEMSNSPNLLPSGLLGPVTGNVMIGEHPAGTNYFWGQIDDVRIYDHALTQQEIQTIYLNTTP